MKQISIVFFLGLLMTNSFGQTKFELSNVSKLVGLSDPQISPNGKNIVLVASRPDFDKNRYNSELVIVEITTGKKTVLTQDRQSVLQPRWSPSGDKLAFLARVGFGKEASNQLFILPISGGEAKQITKTPKGVQHYVWSPNANLIAYVTEDEPANKAEIEKGHTVFEVGNNDLFISSQPNPSHIWSINLENGENKKLTSGTWSLPVTIPPGAPSSPLSWSSNGKDIAFVKVNSPYSGDSRYRTLQMLSIADGTMKQITPRNQFESYPSFSIDGSSICYWYKKGENSSDINEIWVTDINGGLGKKISTNLDRDLYRAIWMADNKNLFVGGHNDNKTSLWLLNVNGESKQINVGNISPAWGFWIDAAVGKDGSIAFIGSETTHPSELYYLPNATTAKPVCLTNFNNEVAAMSLGKTETLYWQNDGFSHCGIVTYPTNFDKTKKYPLVLVVHGGPNSASVEGFSRFSQLLANQGYFVFEPNYRGSDNLGSAYKMAIVEDAGAGPGRDVMAGLTKLKSNASIDTNNVAVTGWSYGGYMTVWLAGHYGGWKAAVAGAAVTDWVDQYNFSDANAARGSAIGGSPWKDNIMQKYMTQSPITEAKNIKAATLILANTGDPRVPISQSYKLFHSLKDNNVTTKFYAWPIPAHNASDPISQMDRDKLWIDWLNKYLKN